MHLFDIICIELNSKCSSSDSSISSSYSVYIQYCPLSRDGWIHLIPSAIVCTPSLCFAQFRASSFFIPIFSVFSFTCFFQVFTCPHFLLPLITRSRATLTTLFSSLLSTCPYHLTPFIVASWSVFSFYPSCPCVLHSFFCLQLSHVYSSHHSFLRSQNCFFISF